MAGNFRLEVSMSHKNTWFIISITLLRESCQQCWPGRCRRLAVVWTRCCGYSRSKI
ncbi:hypothetical protein GQ44DRAFT_713739 [Phaeosphaeriaceae sp. PMI808]|nr:hypothetical protein GQ44DRAFT_713739 [Phaeosphaeriaceae sp. PMI808]